MHATLFVTVRPAHGADPCRLSTVYLCADVSGARVRIERHVFNLTKIAGTTHLHGQSKKLGDAKHAICRQERRVLCCHHAGSSGLSLMASRELTALTLRRVSVDEALGMCVCGFALYNDAAFLT